MRCATVAALVLASLGCTEQRTSIGATASLAPPVGVEMLTMTFHEAGRSWQVRGADFVTDASTITPHTTRWDTGTVGSLDIAFQLADSAGTVIAAGQISLDLRPDWSWSVELANVTEDPRLRCLGCFGSRAFPIAPASRAPGHDSLWAVWGGNSISHPVLY